MSFVDTLKNIIYQLFFVRTWGPAKLAEYVRYLKKYSVLPNKAGLPDYISLPTYFWDRIRKLRNYTDKDGHEYASSVYVIDGDIILTPFIRGEPHHVQVKYNIKWHYEPLDTNRYIKKIYVNNDKVLEKTVYKYQIPQKLYSVYLFSVHTHPYHADLGRYGFYSNQDIKSLVASNAVALGLITDKFYLVFKTNNSPHRWDYSGYITENLLLRHGFCLYKAEFGRKLEKL